MPEFWLNQKRAFEMHHSIKATLRMLVSKCHYVNLEIWRLLSSML
uniref:Uncharacterized protein n=1 Tax=Rhizophora mucronata TaxID=61149 RepID=A0A2P2N5M1_RHIMU